MRRWLIVLALSGLPPVALYGQEAPRLDPTAARSDSVPALTAADSASRYARVTASRQLFHQCSGYAFQTCGSGETAARLSLDGTAYGVLLSVQDRQGGGHSIFLWRITGRVNLEGAESDDDGSGGPGGKVRKQRRSRRGG